MVLRRKQVAGALVAMGLLVGGLSGGFALAASEHGHAMHHGDAMHHSSNHGAAMSHDSEMPEEGAAMSHGAAMQAASVTG
jgi:hypothetical protein